jgi:hypothetical protein
MTASVVHHFREACVEAGGHVAAFAVLYLSPSGRGRLRSSRVRGTDRFKACGFLVVRVSNTDVYDNLEGVLEMIESTLRLD